VQPGQWIAGSGVVEFADDNRLPIFEGVALFASLTEPSVMRILVAGGASRRQAKVGSIQVLNFYGRAFLGADSRRSVAAIAS